MAATIVGAFQPEMHNLITESRVLLIGTGGIGCEVLKNLVLMGFTELDIIDLDTIEVSNLNRQFLFSKESVGKAKSHVAKEAVLKFNPNVNIKSHMGDIMDQRYGSSFFSQFKLVINALDNKKARNHVNRMCLAINIPLIESGTMGYNGQVEFIKKGMTQCYECLPKPEPKSYPMCTIRNTPKEPIHCIIWAKYLFSQLFGLAEEEVSMETTILTSELDTKSVVSTSVWAKRNDFDPTMIFKKVFFNDIDYLLSMSAIREKQIIKPLKESIIDHPRVEYCHEPDTKVLSLAQYFSMFLDSVDNIRKKFKDSIGSLIWDKDNDDFMNFIVSSTNIRSEIFNIPIKSYFDIKTMAGNIVPAIATANAIIAGQIVIHALRILRSNFKHCQSVFLREWPNHKGAVIVKDKNLLTPNPKCTVCSSNREIVLYADCNMFTVKQLEDFVLKQKLHMVSPDLMIESGQLIISSDEDDQLDLYSKSLVSVGIRDYCKLIAEDFFQNYKVTIMFRHKVYVEAEILFEITGETINRNEDTADFAANKCVDNSNIDEDDDCEFIEVLTQMEDDMTYDNGNAEFNVVSATGTHTQKIEASKEMTVTIGEHKINDDEKVNVNSDEQKLVSDEVLGLKRKAESDENVSEPKKNRVDE